MKTLSLVAIHRIFTVATLAVFLLFVAFMGYLSLTYGGFLTGRIEARAQTELLTRFNAMRFETAVKRLERRRGLPDPDPSLTSPFGIFNR